MIYCAILASGKGSRMGDTIVPKQFLIIGNEPIIIYTVKNILKNKNINTIFVLVSREWVTHLESLLIKYDVNNKVKILIGGSTRNETLEICLNHIVKNNGIDEKDIILTHDAVRPFISQTIINDNIKEAYYNGCVTTAIPAIDTIAEMNFDDCIINIPDRSKMVLLQTPQTFNIKKFMNLYSKLNDKEKSLLTDASKVFYFNNKEVKIVRGDLLNFKITTSFDLEVAKALVLKKF